MDTRDFIENKKRRIIDDYVNTLRNKVEDTSRQIWDNDEVDAFADQHNGKTIPFAYSRIYGPITHADASLSKFILPTKPSPSILIGREGSFTWTETSIMPIVQETSGPVSLVNPPPDAPPAGDLFDSYLNNNGGGVFTHPSTGRINGSFARGQAIGFDIVLYDRKRGRSLHEDKLPFEAFFGAQVTNKRLAEPIRLDPNTDLEPRLYINTPQFDQTFIATGGGEFRQVTTTWWIQIMFKGRLTLEA